MAQRSDLFIRLSLDYANHPKIASLSDAAFRAHVEMILYSRKYETDGIIKNRIANRVGSGWDTEVLNELLTNDEEAPSLIQLENGDYELHGYADMQETKAEIEARRRKNASNGRRGGRPRKPKETQSVTESDTQSVPQPQTQSGTQTKAETETETETEVKRVTRSPKRPLPDDWAPTEKHAAKAAELSLNLQAEAEKFRTFHQSKDNRYADWGKAFHTWLTRAAEYQHRPAPQSAADRVMQRAQERHERLATYQPTSWDQVFNPKQIGEGP